MPGVSNTHQSVTLKNQEQVISTVKVLVVDDDVLVRTAIRLMLKSQIGIDVVAEMSEGSGIIQTITDLAPDVVLLDVHMVPINGVALASSVRRRFPDIRIVLMSSFHSREFEDHARHAGADQFIVKTDSFDVILHALRGPGEMRQMAIKQLSSRESVVAELASRGLSNEQIAKQTHLSTNTVKTYLSRVFKKVGARNRVDLANYVNGVEKLPN